MDSVFSPPVLFPDDRPLISPDAIARPLNRLEEITSEHLQGLVQTETAKILVKQRDLKIDGVASLIATASIRLRNKQAQSISGLWRKGYLFGGKHGIREMKAAVRRGGVASFQIIDDRIAELNELEPEQIVNTSAGEAVQRRSLDIAGGYSEAVISELQALLIRSILPTEPDGQVLPRSELRARIQNLLNVSKRRADNIARTETTYAYNQGRLSSFRQTPLVTHVRFLAIDDARTTAICRSRNGLIISLQNAEAIRANSPPLHYSCRSVLSPIMPSVSLEHAEMLADPLRDPNNRELVALLPGWRAA